MILPHFRVVQRDTGVKGYMLGRSLRERVARFCMTIRLACSSVANIKIAAGEIVAVTISIVPAPGPRVSISLCKWSVQ